MTFFNKIYIIAALGVLGGGCYANKEEHSSQVQGKAPAAAPEKEKQTASEKSFSEQLTATLSDPNYPFRYAAFADGIRTRDKCGREVQMFVASPWVISSGDPRDAQSGLCPSRSCAVVTQPVQPACDSSQIYVVNTKTENPKPCITYSFARQVNPALA